MKAMPDAEDFVATLRRGGEIALEECRKVNGCRPGRPARGGWLPRSLGGWLRLLAWWGLLLFVFLRCGVAVEYGVTPAGPNGKRPAPFFYFEFRCNGEPIVGAPRAPC